MTLVRILPSPQPCLIPTPKLTTKWHARPSSSPHSHDIANSEHPQQWKWKLVIAYEGTRYAGWQYQEKPKSVQCLVEEALRKTTKLGREDLAVVGASRTDAGVHAWGQVAHFMTSFLLEDLEKVHASLNGILPLDIRVREITAVPPIFHARFSALKKTYVYKIYNSTIMDPFQRLYAQHCSYKLNADAMSEGANFFVGQHDFSALRTSNNFLPKDPIREIFRFDLVKMGSLLQLEIEGTGFFYRQIRNMVGLLIEIGKEALPVDIVRDVLKSCDRRKLAKLSRVALPQGLCLMNVDYCSAHLESPIGSPLPSFGRHKQIQKCILPYS